MIYMNVDQDDVDETCFIPINVHDLTVNGVRHCVSSDGGSIFRLLIAVSCSDVTV